MAIKDTAFRRLKPRHGCSDTIDKALFLLRQLLETVSATVGRKFSELEDHVRQVVGPPFCISNQMAPICKGSTTWDDNLTKSFLQDSGRR